MKKVLIQTESLCKSYTSGKSVANILKNISMEIYEGDFTIIMGTSGSGKSTLLYSISSMDQPTSGKVLFQNKDISHLNEKEAAMFRRKNISFIFQNINLLPDLTAFENVTYPSYLTMPKKKVNEEGLRLLGSLGLMEEKDKYPSEMSGGQQQRVAIARALTANTKVIFGDEPTGSLNLASGNQVLDVLTNLNREGHSIVMVTHDLKACARGNRLLFLSDGRIEGDLSLGQYDAREQRDREEVIFEYLKNHRW